MPSQPDRRWTILLAAGAIALAALAAYHNTFSVPSLFDDRFTIMANPSIQHLRALGAVLFPPNDIFSAGRPFLNLSFALNYAVGGVSVKGYHVVNLVIHILAGITLFGIVRITLSRPRLKEKYGEVALIMALAVATLWTLHPVQTESVTYITQRTESLMGLFYLLTLYLFIRAALSPGSGLWAGLSVAACALGMMSKEVMVTAPVVVLLYDRTFLAGTFREAWRQRWRIYLGLAATWLVLAGLMASSNLQDRSIGYGTAISGWTYALTESKAVVSYLRLALWPHPLIFDYGLGMMINHVTDAAPYLLILLLLLALTLLALRRWPSLGFLGAWFFLILAPTSSIVPLAGQPLAEHRLYLPVAAIVGFVVVGLHAAFGRKGLLVTFPALACLLGSLTVWRNADYRDEIAIWSDTASKCPENFRAQNNLGNALVNVRGRLPEAIAHYEAALRIKPDFADAHNNLGTALVKIPSRLPEAIAEYKAAIKINPRFAEAHNNLGIALAKIPNRLPEAIAEYKTALRINPAYADAGYNLGAALAKIPGRLPEAIAEYEAVLKINPLYAEAHNNLGVALMKIPGRLPEAIPEYEAALKINPDYAEAHNNLGVALAKTPGRLPEAIAHYESALRIDPNEALFHKNLADAHNSLGIMLAKTPGRLAEAIAHFEAALKIDPEFAEAHFNLGNALLEAGRSPEAWLHLEAAARLRPDWEPELARMRLAQP